MRAGVEPRGAVALLLAGALTPHVFMLSDGHEVFSTPVAVGVASGHEADGHGSGGEAARPDGGAMAAFCFSVLAARHVARGGAGPPAVAGHAHRHRE
jgi:hypothetical protein